MITVTFDEESLNTQVIVYSVANVSVFIGCFCYLLFYFCNRFPCILRLAHIAENWLEFLILLPPASKCWDYRAIQSNPNFLWLMWLLSMFGVLKMMHLGTVFFGFAIWDFFSELLKFISLSLYRSKKLFIHDFSLFLLTVLSNNYTALCFFFVGL